MAFNHYAKIKRILAEQPEGWYIVRINEPTSAKNFKGETIEYPYFYRVLDVFDRPIPFCKFQKLDLFAKTMDMPLEAIIIVEQ